MRLVFLFAALIALTPSAAMATEEPAHRVVERVGAIEIREYAAMIVAEVEVSGDQTRASNRGFRPLANYIFGGNTPRQEIAMTTPVTAAPSRGQEIAMTAPVTYEPGENGRWTVAFVMPAEWTMETLPEPNDPNVTLREVAPKRIAAIRFNGGRNPRRFAARQAELMAFLDERGLTAAGDPTFAYYSPPWIPTALRRNEIWVELAEA
jgi:hypothetical protein